MTLERSEAQNILHFLSLCTRSLTYKLCVFQPCSVGMISAVIVQIYSTIMKVFNGAILMGEGMGRVDFFKDQKIKSRKMHCS